MTTQTLSDSFLYGSPCAPSDLLTEVHNVVDSVRDLEDALQCIQSLITYQTRMPLAPNRLDLLEYANDHVSCFDDSFQVLTSKALRSVDELGNRDSSIREFRRNVDALWDAVKAADRLQLDYCRLVANHSKLPPAMVEWARRKISVFELMQAGTHASRPSTAAR